MRLYGRGDVVVDAALPANLPPRSKRLLSQILDPDADFAAVVIAHGRAEDVALFGVLRELARIGRGPDYPVHFIDLLHGRGEPVTAYNRARLEAMKAWLEALAGQAISEAAIRSAGPTARAPRTDAGSRVFVTGSPHEDDRLNILIEAAGAVIVGQDHDPDVPSLDPALPPLDALSRRPQAFDTGPTASTPARVAALRRRIAELNPDAVLHLRIDGDEAAPWDLNATTAVMAELGVPLLALSAPTAPTPTEAEALQRRLSTFLNGALAPEPTPQARSAAPSPPPAAGRRSRKALDCIQDFSAHQRAWFAEVRTQAENGPFAVVNADAPQEILRAMGIPFVVNQWWAAIVAAKQKSKAYAGHLRAAGYPTGVEAYSAQGLAAALASGEDDPPWGGLPNPDVLALIAGTDAGPKLFEAWAQETGADLTVFERSVESRWAPPIDWWDEMPERWATALEPERLDLLTAQLEAHVVRLETLTGRTLDRTRLVEVMRLVNEQEDFYRRTRDLVAAARPAPIGIADSMPATMTPQWQRGSTWGRDAACRFHEEVRRRVEEGVAACPGERIRLMWVGRGLWGDMGFYQRWEESHGAVFVWSMYLGLAADGYIREFEGEHDVMRALAARFLTMGDELRMPTWAGAWHVKEARTHGVHGAVAIDDADPLVLDALRRAGVPVLRVEMNNMAESASAVEAEITEFIESLHPDQAQTGEFPS